MTIDPDNYYTKDELLATIPVSYEILCLWIDDGLAFIPTGPDEYLVKGLDLINHLRKSTVIRQRIEDN
jgi:hypothetical protein